MNDLIKEAIWDAKIYRFSVYEDDAISENDGNFILCSKVDVCINVDLSILFVRFVVL